MRRVLWETSEVGYMFGQFALAVPDVPDDPVDGVFEDGVVVVLLVAALAAAAPPATRAPETARTAAALRMGLMFLTSFVARVCVAPVGASGLRGP